MRSRPPKWRPTFASWPTSRRSRSPLPPTRFAKSRAAEGHVLVCVSGWRIGIVTGIRLLGPTQSRLHPLTTHRSRSPSSPFIPAGWLVSDAVQAQPDAFGADLLARPPRHGHCGQHRPHPRQSGTFGGGGGGGGLLVSERIDFVVVQRGVTVAVSCFIADTHPLLTPPNPLFRCQWMERTLDDSANRRTCLR